MSVYLPQHEVLSVFDGCDMLNDAYLSSVYRGLLGGAPKPFDCVGTVTETREAARLIMSICERENKPVPVNLRLCADLIS